MTKPSAWALALFALLAAPGMLVAQGVPLGPEFLVNSYTLSHQNRPSVASDAAGNFVVVWESLNQDGDNFGIFAQRYDSTGTPVSPEFRVNSFTTGNQYRSSVASDPAGNLVVVWHSDGHQDGSYSGVFAQRYDSTGTPLGGEFRVNSFTTGSQFSPSVASDSAGNFVVVWQSDQDGSVISVFAQRYAGTGAPLGGEFRVNTYTVGNFLASPSVASDSAGNFVVVWHRQDGSGLDVFGRRYATTGAPLGGEFRVNSFTSGNQYYPSVASDSAGNFVVTWISNNDIRAKRYSKTGAPRGREFRVNTYTTNGQAFPSVASDSAGNFVVTWQSQLQDGSYYGIFGQRYAKVSTGVPLGGEFRVNTYTTGRQTFPSVASDSAGNFVVTWASDSQDGDGYGVFAQRYSPILSVELQSFPVE